MLSVGYGYLIGMTAVTLLLRLLDAIGVRWSLLWVVLPMVALACAAFVHLRLRNPMAVVREHGRRATDVLVAMPAATRAIFYVLLGLTVARVIALGLEVVWTPLLTYDAWAQWASKARVWYGYGSIQPFVSASEWGNAPGTMHFTDTHPEYPGTVPLFQVWTAICLGRWDESLVNLPWAVELHFARHRVLRADAPSRIQRDQVHVRRLHAVVLAVPHCPRSTRRDGGCLHRHHLCSRDHGSVAMDNRSELERRRPGLGDGDHLRDDEAGRNRLGADAGSGHSSLR